MMDHSGVIILKKEESIRFQIIFKYAKGELSRAGGIQAFKLSFGHEMSGALSQFPDFDKINNST